MHTHHSPLPHNDGSPAAQVMQEMEAMRRLVGSFKPEPPLTRSDIMMLATIDRFSAVPCKTATVSSLARSMRQTPPGISQRISLLEQQGFVRRKEDKADRRMVTIELTEKGREMACGAMRGFMRLFNRALEELGPEDTQQFIALTRKLHDAIEKIQKTQGEGEQVP
jgi:DNA-binding MarR family transcriptional regulator